MFLSGMAMLLCLAPAAAVLAWASHGGQSPESRILWALGGAGVRLGVVVGAGIFLIQVFPERFPSEFLIWLLVFYLFILALEITLLLHWPEFLAEAEPVRLHEHEPGGCSDSRS